MKPTFIALHKHLKNKIWLAFRFEKFGIRGYGLSEHIWNEDVCKSTLNFAHVHIITEEDAEQAKRLGLKATSPFPLTEKEKSSLLAALEKASCKYLKKGESK